MAHYLANYGSLTCILVFIALFSGSPVKADIESENPGNITLIKESNRESIVKPTQIILDEDGDSTLLDEDLESTSEFQELIDQEKDSRFHLDGEIMLKEDANIKNPSLHDIDSFEIDITIDFE